MKIEHIAVLALVAFVVSYLAYRFGFFRLSQEEKQQNFLSLKYLFGAFFVFIGIQVFIMPLLGLFWIFLKTGNLEYVKLGTSSRGWISIIGIWLVALGMLAYLQLLDSKNRSLIWNKAKKFKSVNGVKQFLFGGMAWFITYPIVSTVGQSLGYILYLLFGVSPVEQTPVKALKTTLSDPLVFSFMTLTIVFLVPVLEEIMFRGLVQNFLKNYFRRMPAIALTALVFALFHYSPEQGISNIEFIITLFVLSCFLGFIYERQASLWAPIGLHVAFNGVSVLVILFFK